MGRVPKLDQMDKEAIRSFMKKYGAYLAMVGERVALQPQLLVEQEILEVMVYKLSCTMKQLCSLDPAKFMEELGSLTAARGYVELELGMKEVSMRNDDLSLSTVMRYNDDWPYISEQESNMVRR